MATISETISTWIKDYDEGNELYKEAVELALFCSEDLNRGCREHLNKIEKEV